MAKLGNKLVPDPHLGMVGEGGGGHPDPQIRKGAGLPKKFFRPFGPQLGPKIRGGPGPPGPSPESATVNKCFCQVVSSHHVGAPLHTKLYKFG